MGESIELQNLKAMQKELIAIESIDKRISSNTQAIKVNDSKIQSERHSSDYASLSKDELEFTGNEEKIRNELLEQKSKAAEKTIKRVKNIKSVIYILVVVAAFIVLMIEPIKDAFSEFDPSKGISEGIAISGFCLIGQIALGITLSFKGFIEKKDGLGQVFSKIAMLLFFGVFTLILIAIPFIDFSDLKESPVFLNYPVLLPGIVVVSLLISFLADLLVNKIHYDLTKYDLFKIEKAREEDLKAEERNKAAQEKYKLSVATESSEKIKSLKNDNEILAAKLKELQKEKDLHYQNLLAIPGLIEKDKNLNMVEKFIDYLSRGKADSIKECFAVYDAEESRAIIEAAERRRQMELEQQIEESRRRQDAMEEEQRRHNRKMEEEAEESKRKIEKYIKGW